MNDWDAAWSFRRSFLTGKENLEKFPDFQPTIMLQGSMQVAAGTIPPGYQWLSNLLGINGTIDTGMQNLEKVLNSRIRMRSFFMMKRHFIIAT